MKPVVAFSIYGAEKVIAGWLFAQLVVLSFFLTVIFGLLGIEAKKALYSQIQKAIFASTIFSLIVVVAILFGLIFEAIFMDWSVFSKEVSTVRWKFSIKEPFGREAVRKSLHRLNKK